MARGPGAASSRSLDQEQPPMKKVRLSSQNETELFNNKDGREILGHASTSALILEEIGTKGTTFFLIMGIWYSCLGQEQSFGQKMSNCSRYLN